MSPLQLDEVDRGILYLLQRDARNATAAGVGERVGVSASTVRNRLAAMEEAGVIEGYHPQIDYERAGFQLHVFIACHAPVARRAELAGEVLDFHNVVNVREMLTGSNNLYVEAIATDSDAVDRITTRLDEIGLDLVSTNIVKESHAQPFDHFGDEVVEE
ncbi:Lrp/AsnC family transcriptional regulator [Halomarina halobia]|uniref:Lrp/AsnC family transcriptional regulator n=1 Tax=Halomarina halobia TaxID=3033386 RepID=A0ABD6A4X1_9EURY|nr:Lrp/AsnC family transcriptional regulator [Halomarina sp. PSR21]